MILFKVIYNRSKLLHDYEHIEYVASYSIISVANKHPLAIKIIELGKVEVLKNETLDKLETVIKEIIRKRG